MSVSSIELDRHLCLVFNDRKLKLDVSSEASRRLWRGIIGEFWSNVKVLGKEFQ